MSEPTEKKRGWWSRFVGADGTRVSPEEVIQELARELTETREFADRLGVERDTALAANARARAEIEQVRRAAETQLANLRAQLEALRREHGEERAQREQVQRDAHARERELGAVIAGHQGEVTAARRAAVRVEEDLGRAKKAMADLQAQADEARRATAELGRELTGLRRSSELALRIALGEHGAQLARAAARSIIDRDGDKP